MINLNILRCITVFFWVIITLQKLLRTELYNNISHDNGDDNERIKQEFYFICF